MAAKKPAAPKKAPAEKKPSLDIKDEMYWADKKNFDWLSNQPEELRKTFSPLIAMKWFSICKYDTPDYIFMVNEFLNIADFWEMSSKHPDLCWRIMCAIGMKHNAQPYAHGWLPLATAKKTVGKVDQVFLELHPNLNDEELAIIRGKYDTESFKQLLKDMGKPDADIKPLVDEFKKKYG